MSRKKTFSIFIPLAVVLVVADQLAKAWASSALEQGAATYDLGLVDLTLVHNAGAAFGMGQGNGIFFVSMAVVICIAAVLWLIFAKRKNVFEVVGLSLIVAGGIGNCIDRLAMGYVVDFIRFTFIDFPVFNVADICVTCGVVVFLVSFIASELKADADEERKS